MSCTADDHDTTDMFCAACGEQLHEAGQCDWCERGQHEGDGSPFCPCCGFRRVVACTDNQHEQRRELLAQHKALAEAAHERGDIPEANYQYGWVDALAADLADNQPQEGSDDVSGG